MDWKTEFVEEIRRIIEKHPNIYLTKNSDGTYCGEIYANYLDEMSNKAAIEILEHKSPMEAFWNMMQEWYMDVEVEYKTEVINLIREDMECAYPEGLTDEQDAFLKEWCDEIIYYHYPEDHFFGAGILCSNYD